MAELLRRRVVPSTVIALSTIDVPARTAARLRRAARGRGRVELYFAFDDACSAAAVVDLADRLSGRPVDLVLMPVVDRGIPEDPAVDDKRVYAIEDARRIGRRSGLVLEREEALDPGATAFLAEWAAARPQSPELIAFCVSALRALWFETSGPVVSADYTALWREHLGDAPEPEPQAVRRNERRMRKRGPYDTPAAVIGREWYFAHDRLNQIADRLDRLGWRQPA